MCARDRRISASRASAFGPGFTVAGVSTRGPAIRGPGVGVIRGPGAGDIREPGVGLAALESVVVVGAVVLRILLGCSVVAVAGGVFFSAGVSTSGTFRCNSQVSFSFWQVEKSAIAYTLMY